MAEIRCFNSSSKEVIAVIYDLRFTIYEQKRFWRVNRKSSIANLFWRNRPAPVDHAGAHVAGMGNGRFASVGGFSVIWNRDQIGGRIFYKFAGLCGHARDGPAA